MSDTHASEIVEQQTTCSEIDERQTTCSEIVEQQTNRNSCTPSSYRHKKRGKNTSSKKNKKPKVIYEIKIHKVVFKNYGKFMTKTCLKYNKATIETINNSDEDHITIRIQTNKLTQMTDILNDYNIYTRCLVNVLTGFQKILQ
jgi:hypothetical protein